MLILNDKKSWARQAGLLPIKLNPIDGIDKYIMLDGGYYDFCLDFANIGEAREDRFSSSWSTNTKNYITVAENSVSVYNWMLGTVTELPSQKVIEKFDQFVQILNNNSYRSDEDLVPFVLRVFHQMRNLTCELDQPLQALNLLYKLLISIDEDINTIDCNKWQITDVPLPDMFETFVNQIKSGVNNIRPNLDLILRHCSGPLFQEAHREAMWLNPDRDLFGGVSHIIQYKKDAYSSIHYTPQYLARSIVENSIRHLDLTKPVLKILDPACGSGAFLVEALKQLKELNYSGQVQLFAWDCSQSAISTTTFLLHYEKRTQWKDGMEYRVKVVSDSLQEVWDDYDLILMNPPFISWELLRDNNQKDAIMTIFDGLKMKNRPNQAAAFFYKAIQSLTPNGILGAVLPSSILLQGQYDALREKVLERVTLQTVARLGNYIFEDALTDVSFVIVQNSRSLICPETIWCKNEKGVAYEALKSWRKMTYSSSNLHATKDYSVQVSPSFPIVDKTWNVIPKRDEDYLRHINQWIAIGKLVMLGDIFSISQGLLTGRKNVFELSVSEFERLPECEKVFYRPLISSGSITEGEIHVKQYIWFPYDERGLMIKDEESLKQLEYTWARLSPHRNELEKRQSVKHWWELTRPRTWQYNNSFRLYSQRFGSSSSFGIGDREDYVIAEGNAFEFRSSIHKYRKDDYYFYLSLFSSKLFDRLLSIYSKRIMAGYDLGKIQIQRIPIVDVKVGNVRGTEAYSMLVKIGKELSKGASFMRGMIDKYICDFYPNYGDTYFNQ